MNEPHNLFAAPQADLRAEDLGSRDFQLASLGARFGGSLLDGLTFLAVLLLCMLTFGVDFGALEAIVGYSSHPDEALMTKAFILGAVVFWVIQIVLLVKRGQTVGKLIVGTRIVRPDGSRATAGRLVVARSLIPVLLSMVPYVGNLFQLVNALMIFRDSRRCWHDDIADTIVIKV